MIKSNNNNNNDNHGSDDNNLVACSTACQPAAWQSERGNLHTTLTDVIAYDQNNFNQ